MLSGNDSYWCETSRVLGPVSAEAEAQRMKLYQTYASPFPTRVLLKP